MSFMEGAGEAIGAFGKAFGKGASSPMDVSPGMNAETLGAASSLSKMTDAPQMQDTTQPLQPMNVATAPIDTSTAFDRYLQRYRAAGG